MNRLEKINRVLNKHKLTKKQIAEELKISATSVSLWCNGKMTSINLVNYFKNLCGQEFIDKLPAH